MRLRTACLYGQTRLVLSPPLLVVCTATGRAASGRCSAAFQDARSYPQRFNLSLQPEICAWKMAIWFSFSFIASYILFIVYRPQRRRRRVGGERPE